MQTEPPNSSSKKKKKKMKLDRISNLQDDVTQQILSYLPIRDAVRTRILSRNWRCKCSTIPCLVFDDRCCVSDQTDRETKRMRKRKTSFSSIVDQVLALHTGSIETFTLSRQNKHLDARDIDRWIFGLSQRSIKKFVLDQWKGTPYNVSSRLFMFRDLIHLELYNCVLDLPLTFKGFRALKILNLQMVRIAQDVFEKMIGYCPLIERLILCDFQGITHLNIDATNLQYLMVDGAFEDVDIGMNTSNLVHVTIIQQKAASSSCSNFLKFFSQLTRVEKLSIDGFFLEVMDYVTNFMYFDHLIYMVFFSSSLLLVPCKRSCRSHIYVSSLFA